MSAVVKLSSKLPGDFETNGLDQHTEWLQENPKKLLVAAVWLDVQRIVVDTDTGEHIPTVRVRRIEPLGETGEVSDLMVKVIQAAVEKRTGRTPIPFDIAEVTEDRHSDALEL